MIRFKSGQKQKYRLKTDDLLDEQQVQKLFRSLPTFKKSAKEKKKEEEGQNSSQNEQSENTVQLEEVKVEKSEEKDTEKEDEKKEPIKLPLIIVLKNLSSINKDTSTNEFDGESLYQYSVFNILTTTKDDGTNTYSPLLHRQYIHLPSGAYEIQVSQDFITETNFHIRKFMVLKRNHLMNLRNVLYV